MLPPMSMPTGLPPLHLSGGTGGAATAGGHNSTGGGGGLDSSGWNVNFGGSQTIGQTPHRVAFRADPYGMPQTVANSTMMTGQRIAPTTWLLVGLAALLVLKRAT